MKLTSETIMIATVAVIVSIILLALPGCTPTENPEPVVQTEEVDIPVAQYPEAPAALKRPSVTVTDLPVFVSPTAANANSCLTTSGEQKLQSLMGGRENLLLGWEALLQK